MSKTKKFLLFSLKFIVLILVFLIFLYTGKYFFGYKVKYGGCTSDLFCNSKIIRHPIYGTLGIFLMLFGNILVQFLYFKLLRKNLNNILRILCSFIFNVILTYNNIFTLLSGSIFTKNVFENNILSKFYSYANFSFFLPMVVFIFEILNCIIRYIVKLIKNNKEQIKDNISEQKNKLEKRKVFFKESSKKNISKSYNYLIALLKKVNVYFVLLLISLITLFSVGKYIIRYKTIEKRRFIDVSNTKQLYFKDVANSILEDIFGINYLYDIYYYQDEVIYNLDEYKTMKAISQSEPLSGKYNIKEMFKNEINNHYMIRNFKNNNNILSVEKVITDSINNSTEYSKKYTIYPYDNVKKAYDMLFTNGKVAKTNFKFSDDRYTIYSKDKNIFGSIYVDFKCYRYYHKCEVPSYTEITDSYKIGNKIYAIAVAGFVQNNSMKLIDNSYVQINSEDLNYKYNTLSDEAIKKYRDKLPKYKFEILQDGTLYKFVKASKIN